jgi:uncharacterized membrane protein
MNIFFYFLIYSFCGWFFETAYMWVYHGHIIKRGFLLGPFCIVYGIGTILIICALNCLKTHPIILFLCASVITSVLELITGILLKTLLNMRLWDYSSKFANLNGYICLSNTILWGVLAIFVVYIAHPAIKKAMDIVPVKAKKLIFSSTLILFCADLYISIYTSLNGTTNIAWLTNLVINQFETLHNIASKATYLINQYH